MYVTFNWVVLNATYMYQSKYLACIFHTQLNEQGCKFDAEQGIGAM